MESGNWELLPYVRLRWKSSEFNNRYYGLNIDSPGSAFDISIGAEARYQVYQNLYLIGRAQVRRLDDDTADTSVIERQTTPEFYLGIAFFNDKTKKPQSHLQVKPYVRLAHGWATPSSLAEIIRFNARSDPYDNQLTSLFYGHPLADDLFGIPFQIYLTPGFVYHHSSEVQGSTQEYVIAVKAYYTFKWPIRWRVGAAEGLSYAKDIPFVEQTDIDRKDYRASNLLNFLDFSIDFSLGEVFNADSMRDLWLGYSIHHRSGIFETSSLFGRIKGDSNYQTVYLQYHW
jgi:outer membrane protein